MTDILLGTHTLSSHGVKVARVHLYDWIILLLLVVIDGLLNSMEPFHRFVGEEMMTDIKFPFHKDTIPFWAVPFFAVLLPIVIFSIYYCFRKDVYDFHHAVLGLLFSVLLTGVITDSIKDIVGRPRPNFFWRCFPDGKAVFDRITGDVVCHGNAKDIKEGYKSFPSGHTSWSFAGLSFLSWYLSGKFRAFDRRGHVAKLCIVFFPILVAALVGASRVDDYWHHWTDVFTGALIGSTMAVFCYLQLFPCPHDKDDTARCMAMSCIEFASLIYMNRLYTWMFITYPFPHFNFGYFEEKCTDTGNYIGGWVSLFGMLQGLVGAISYLTQPVGHLMHVFRCWPTEMVPILQEAAPTLPASIKQILKYNPWDK